jgi:hypothetical protein
VDELDICGSVATKWMYPIKNIDENLEVVCAEHGNAKGVNGRRIYIFRMSVKLSLLNTYIGLMLWSNKYGMLMKKMEMLVRCWKVQGENFT